MKFRVRLTRLSTNTEPTCITSTCIAWIPPSKLLRSGLDEMFDRGAIMLVEWGEAYRKVLPRVAAVKIRIQREGEDRLISIDGLL